MIVYPLASPAAFGFASVAWGYRTNTGAAKGAFNFQDVRQVYDGEYWFGQLTLVPQQDEDAYRVRAWLAALRGPLGTFLLGDPLGAEPLGGILETPGTPVVEGADQAGNALAVSGLPAGMAGWLTAGSYFQIGAGEDALLFMSLTDVDADSNGEATLDIFPALRAPPDDQAPLILTEPAGVFRLSSNRVRWLGQPGDFVDGVALDVEEYVRGAA